MADIRITNCHIHTFTAAHVPKFYPHWALYPFRVVPGLIRGVSKGLSLIGQEDMAEVVGRLERFQRTGDTWRQETILREVMRMYPAGSRFVVLPMDMAHMGYGPVQKSLQSQHQELADLSEHPDLAGRILPFATVFPDSDDSLAECLRALRDERFKGLKIYPRLGFAPDHPALMRHVYPLVRERNIPVMSHCARGGVRGKSVRISTADAYTDPRAVLPVLDAFEGLRLCLAHFGGHVDWRTYVNDGIDPDIPADRAQNWLASILDLLREDQHDGLWTDISYTLFTDSHFVPFLKVFLKDDRIREKVLFGSDFYMTRQEERSERAVSFLLRDALGEEDFGQIAQTNPKVWLGESV